jgi:hypothetical protein
MDKYIDLLKLSVTLLSLFVLGTIINNNNIYATSTESNKNQTNTESTAVHQSTNSKPMISVSAFCAVASTVIPGEFIGTGFTPNTNVIVEANFNKSTNQGGNVTGEFNLNTQIQEPNTYSDYFLHIYSLDNPDEETSASLNIC